MQDKAASWHFDSSVALTHLRFGFDGQQREIDELHARIQEAETEKQRLHAEVERLRTCSSDQAMA